MRRFCDKTRSVTSVTETIAVGEQKVGVPVFPKQEGSHVIGLPRRPKNRSQATPIRLYSRLRLYSCSCLYGAGSCGCQRNFQTSTRRHGHQRPNLVHWSITAPSQFTCVLTDARVVQAATYRSDWSGCRTSHGVTKITAGKMCRS